MRTSLAQATAFLSSLASATVIPSSGFHSSSNDITTVAGTTGSDRISVNFRAPCQGCFIGTDDGLELTLEIDSAVEECTTNPPRLNGLSLGLATGHDSLNGQFTFKSKPSNGLSEKEINAVWTSTCLKGQASFLTVKFSDIDGDNQVKEVSGFTASFTQKGVPSILRLQDKPVQTVDADEVCESWLKPDHTVSINTSPILQTVDELLDDQYKKLDDLMEQLVDKHGQVREVEHAIILTIKNEFKSCSSLKCWWDTAKSKIPDVCRLITAHWTHHKTRVSGCTEGDTQSPCSAEESSPEKQLVAAEDTVSPSSAQVDDIQSMTISPSVTDADPTPTPSNQDSPLEALPTDDAIPPELHVEVTPIDGSSDEPLPGPVSTAGSEEPSDEPNQGHHGPPPWFRPHDGDGPGPGHHGPPPWFKPHDGDGPGPGHHGPPPWFKPHDGDGPGPGHHGPPPWFKPHDGDGPGPGHHGPPPWFKPHDGDGPGPGHHGPPPWFKPHDGKGPGPGHHGPPPWSHPHDEDGHRGPPQEHPGRPRFGSLMMGGDGRPLDGRLALAVVFLILIIVLAGVLFKLISMCRDPRRRAERAAWVEERRTKRLYRKAACEHKWKTWRRRFLRLRSDEYEEKSQSVIVPDNGADNILQRQLRTLREATDLVRNLVAAEEGRAQIQSSVVPSHDQQLPYSTPEYIPSHGDSQDSHLLSVDGHLPLYVAPPPRYEDELQGEITVVDGFRYTPSNSAYTPSTVDDATESSIVDCSPRLSFETGRSTIYTKERVETVIEPDRKEPVH